MSKFESSAAEELSSPGERPSGTHRRAKPAIPKTSEKPVDVTRFATLEDDDEIEDVTAFAREVEGPIQTLTQDDVVPEEVEDENVTEVFENLDRVPEGPEKRRFLQRMEGIKQMGKLKREQAADQANQALQQEKEETRKHLASVRSEIRRERRRSTEDRIPEARKKIETDIKRVTDIVAAEDESGEGKFLPKVDAYKMIAERYRKITQDLPDYLAQPQTPEIKETIAQLHREADELAEWKKEVDHAKGIGPRALVSNRFHEKAFPLVKEKKKNDDGPDS